jgi:hypothetical protein
LADHFGNNAAFSDQHDSKTLQRIRKNSLAGTCLGALLLLFAACSQAPEPPPSGSLLPAPVEVDRSCEDDGFLATTLYGALQTEIDWRGKVLDCEGMPRPNGEGARLRFAAATGDAGEGLAFIIALPGLERGAAARELPSNVTLIVEGDGRFFSTPGLDSCWTDVDAQAPEQASADRFVISGTVYCIAPIPEVNGMASVSIEELRFSGRLDWSSR